MRPSGPRSENYKDLRRKGPWFLGSTGEGRWALKGGQISLRGGRRRGTHRSVSSSGNHVSHSVEKHASSSLPLQCISEVDCSGSFLSEREDIVQTRSRSPREPVPSEHSSNRSSSSVITLGPRERPPPSRQGLNCKVRKKEG